MIFRPMFEWKMEVGLLFNSAQVHFTIIITRMRKRFGLVHQWIAPEDPLCTTIINVTVLNTMVRCLFKIKKS